jgi:hypothetical protein
LKKKTQIESGYKVPEQVQIVGRRNISVSFSINLRETLLAS